MLNGAAEYLQFDTQQIDGLLQNWRQLWPEMGILALIPEAEINNLPQLQTLCRDQHIPLCGGIFPALITDDGSKTSGIVLLRLNQQPPVFLFADLDQMNDAASVIAAQLEPFIDTRNIEPPALFMMFDSMLQNVGNIVETLYLRLADSVHYAGVNAGSETFHPMPCLFDENRIVQNGACCLLLPPWARMVLEHGYPPPGKVISATSAEGNRIISIDWQPAFAVYKQLAYEEYGIELTADNFYQYASYFPLGILQANNQLVIRIPVALHEDGSIICVGDVPANATLVLLHAPTFQSSQCIPQLCKRLHTDLQFAQGQPLLTFYCAARRIHIGGDMIKELHQLKTCAGASQLVGALSLGEIGSQRSWGYPMFHSAALLCGSWKD